MSNKVKREGHRCSNCGYESMGWFGKCPNCNEFGTAEEVFSSPSTAGTSRAGQARQINKMQEGKGGLNRLDKVAAQDYLRQDSGIAELNSVLGGGVVPGSYIILGAPPGAGKSTLSTQILGTLAKRGEKVALVAGEESASQIKMRFDRLKMDTKHIDITTETNLDLVVPDLIAGGYSMVVVDSIQTVYTEIAPGAKGDISQVKACGNLLQSLAKDYGITVLLIGQVTKSDSLAGPRQLEHIVDIVMVLEGDESVQWRVLRAIKNRFGSIDEIGVFEMTEEGMIGVPDPSTMWLSERQGSEVGLCVCPTLQGTRPIMLEVQCLAAPSQLPMPRRSAAGVDPKRLENIIAVLSRRCGIPIGTYDIFLQLGGGVRSTDPTLDLAIAIALTSAVKGTPPREGTAAWGEITLLGDVRSAQGEPRRKREAIDQGYAKPVHGKKGGKPTRLRDILYEVIGDEI